jgi:cytochrome c oxidase subunit 2
MRFRVIAKTKEDFAQWVSEQQQGPAVPLTDADGKPAGDAQKLVADTFACTNCHILDDSSKASLAPNLTHLASRSTFASGSYELNRANLIKWVMNAPSMIPMESKDCRQPPTAPGRICVGMPSFTENTPAGLPTMTRTQAEQIADYLLELK